MASLGDDIFFAGVSELNARLKAREFTCVQLTRAFLDRLEKVGRRLNAVASPLADRALRRARETDAEIKRGRLRGPLQGVPCGVKDVLATEGKVTSWGARPYASQVFDYDATVVRKLERAGSPLAAKLAMIELAGAGGYRYASASLTGPALNPWDTERWAGGSSGGPAAAVAAGLVPFAIGSETWGSILIPCAFCGVTGLRPTYGLVSRHGAMPVAWSLDRIGPIARSVEDCGHVLRVISGGDDNDSSSSGRTFYFSSRYAREPSGLRVGFAPADFSEHAEPAVRTAFEAALETVRAVGAEMAAVELPDLPYKPVIETIIAAEGSAAFEPLITSGRVDELADPEQIAGLRAGLEIAAKDYLRAMRIRSIIREKMRDIFARVDVLVSPAAFGVAPRIGDRLDEPETAAPGRRRGLRDLTAAANLAGLPALVLPCGFAGGLPLALQMVGRPFNENNLLALGAEFEKRTDWNRRRPPV